MLGLVITMLPKRYIITGPYYAKDNLLKSSFYC